MKRKNKTYSLFTQEDLNDPDFPLVVQCALASEIRDLIVERLMGGLIKPGGTFSVNEYRKIIIRLKKPHYITEATQLPDEETALRDEGYVKLFTAEGDVGTITTDQSLFAPLFHKYIRESTPYKVMEKIINDFNDDNGRIYQGLRTMNAHAKTRANDFENNLGFLKSFDLQLARCREFLNEIQNEAARIAMYQSEKIRQNPNLKNGTIRVGLPTHETMLALIESLVFKSQEMKNKMNFSLSNIQHDKSLYIMFFEALHDFFVQKQAAANFLSKCHYIYFGK